MVTIMTINIAKHDLCGLAIFNAQGTWDLRQTCCGIGILLNLPDGWLLGEDLVIDNCTIHIYMKMIFISQMALQIVKKKPLLKSLCNFIIAEEKQEVFGIGQLLF